jgi:hypothetical protein
MHIQDANFVNLQFLTYDMWAWGSMRKKAANSACLAANTTHLEEG